LVYFFAIEITRRRLASVISRFARRAFASPVDICLLISFRSLIEMPIFLLHGLDLSEDSGSTGSRRRIDSRLIQAVQQKIGISIKDLKEITSRCRPARRRRAGQSAR